MVETDLPEFLKVMNGMASIKKSPLTDEGLELWWDMMREDWTIDDFKVAARRLLKTKQFMPQPSDFHELLNAAKDTAGEAFAWLNQWLVYSPNGYTLNPDCPRRIATSIAAMGGVNAYAMCDSEKLHFLEKRFCEHYDQIGDAMETRAAIPAIAELAKRLTGNKPAAVKQLEHDAE
jgi:hypothetical protein